MRATTIKDIGKKLGVSHTTVSRAITGDTRISEKTRALVLKTAKEMHYTPNAAARGLVRGKSNTVAIVAPTYFANFSTDIMRGIEPEMIKTRYDINYYSTSMYTTIGTQGRDNYVFEKILNEKKADAIIILNTSLMGEDGILERYKKAGIHVVYIEGGGDWGHRVHYDNHMAASLAVKHLIERGRKRIGLLIGNWQYVASQKERVDGFKKGMQEYGGKLEKESIYSFYEDFGDECRNALHHFIENKINAIYVGTGDEDAAKIIAEANKLGLKVPEDLSIVGQDDIRMAGYLGLTTVKQPIVAMGQKAVELAVNAIEKNEVKNMRDEIFYPELIIRKTT